MRTYVVRTCCWTAALLLTGSVDYRLNAEDAIVATGDSKPVDVSASVETGDLLRLSKDDSCWIDRKRKQVVVEAEVCLREGYLEMFACTKGTKEHEAVVALKSKAYVMHAALLAVGAKVGASGAVPTQVRTGGRNRGRRVHRMGGRQRQEATRFGRNSGSVTSPRKNQ